MGGTVAEKKRKRVFIAFAIEDKTLRDFLAGQAKLKQSPFDFIDMGPKEPWDTQWKTNCRTRVMGCDGVVALISKNTTKVPLVKEGCATRRQNERDNESQHNENRNKRQFSGS